MDWGHVFVTSFGVWLGWTLKCYYPDPVEPTPCNCHCNCIHQGVQDSTGPWSHSGVILALVVGCVALVGNAFLALKVTVVSTDSKGEERQLALTVNSVKGKSKGIFSPTKGLTLTD